MSSNDGFGGTGGYGGGGGYGDSGCGSYGPPGGYSSPAGGYPAPTQNNGMAIASLVLGIISLLGICAAGFGGLLGIVAIILGVLARRKVKLGQAGQGGLAIGGIVTGAIGVVLGIVVIVYVVWIANIFSQNAGDIMSCSSLPADQQEACVQSILEGN